MPRVTSGAGIAPESFVNEVAYRYLWHQVRIRSSDKAFLADWPHTDIHYGFAPLTELAFSADPLGGGRFDVSESGDLLTSVDDPHAALVAIAQRVERRAHELLGLKGWSQMRGLLCPAADPDAAQSWALVVDPLEALVPVRRIAVQGNWGLMLPWPDYPLAGGADPGRQVQSRPIGCVVVASRSDTGLRMKPLGGLAAVRSLVECTDRWSVPPGVAVKAAIALIERVPAYEVSSDSYDGVAHQVRDVLANAR
jgi:hypothetical protein